MKKTMIVLIFGIVWLSCEKRTNTKELIDLDKTTPVSVNDLFQSIDVVQLETNEQCLIAHVTKVIFYNERYYVFDVRQQAVFCFDSTGKFLFDISRRGQGPEEYAYLEDFNIDPYNRQLLLLVPFGSLLTCDLDGKFISKIRLPEEIGAYNEVHPMNKDTLIFASLNKYSLATYSKSNNAIMHKRYDGFNNNIFSPLYKTYTYNNQLFFSLPPTNEILNLSDGNSFSWDFGEKNNTPEQFDNVKKLIEEESDNFKKQTRNFVQEKKLNYSITYNYETSRYRICFVDYGKFPELRYLFLDKETNKPVIFDKTTEGIEFLIPSFTGESVVVSECRFKHKFYDEALLSNDQRKIIHAHNEGDNPFLVKYNLKQLK